MSNWRETTKYKDMLTLMGSLSNLFSASNIPFIHYRLTENLFCKYCDARNLSRTDTAYDAQIGDLGIGIKTFTLKTGRSVEKIAEFNKLSTHLKDLHAMDLAQKLADFRNERMQTADNLYNIKRRQYHIIGRNVGQLEVFDTPYDYVDKESIEIISESDKSLHFRDRNHNYTFNRSKSVLQKEFIAPPNKLILPVNIIADPFTLLEQLVAQEEPHAQANTSAILPLFSQRGPKEERELYVAEKSGLNQWNAGGRSRDFDEVYIPVPKRIHRELPDFFPSRDVPFTLYLPNGNSLTAKICQDGGKALMSNPNKALGRWILRDVLSLRAGELLTYDKLLLAGFDALKVTKLNNHEYSIDVAQESYDYEE